MRCSGTTTSGSSTSTTAGYGYWLYDIAVALWELRLRSDYEQFRAALIDGYTQHRQPPGGLAHLDDFIATRDIAFALWFTGMAQTDPAFGADLEQVLRNTGESLDALLGEGSRANVPGATDRLPMGIPGPRAAGSARDVQDGVGVLDSTGQHGDRFCCGKHDQIDLASAGLLPDLLHHRQRAVSAGANHQTAASPGDVLGGRQRSVPVSTAELLGRRLVALSDLSPVNDQIVVVGHAVNAHGPE